MKRILLSAGIVLFVGAFALAGTGAFFSDIETSAGNVFTAGDIDLAIGNSSYYNGSAIASSTWSVTSDLSDGGTYLFFSLDDLKPGDWGEDTVTIEVNSNDAWACSDITLDSSQENVITDPESEGGDTTTPAGELADAVNFVWWADDGDNVFEDDESTLSVSTFGSIGVGATSTTILADASANIWTGTSSDPLIGEDTYYLGFYWCFGDITETPVTAGAGSSPTVDSGFTCDGASVDNTSQTDSMEATFRFRAEQSRNNAAFSCS